MASFCTNCGSRLDSGTKFCAQCGTHAADSMPPKQSQATPMRFETAPSENSEIGALSQPTGLAATSASPASGSRRMFLTMIAAVALIVVVGIYIIFRSHSGTTGTPSGPGGVSSRPATELPVIIQAVIQPDATSIQLSSGRTYLYGMSTGGARSSSPFTIGQFAQGVTASGNLAAALAYGPDNSNQFGTTTYSHEICGVSVAGRWDRFDAFYGVNAELGASNASATFDVAEDSLVVFIGLGGGQNQISLQGIPGLQVDTSNSTAGADIAMIVAHAPLRAGRYFVTETTAETRDMGADNKANLIGVFVFGSKSQ